MDTTTLRVIAHMQAVALLLAVLLTFPLIRHVYVRLDRLSAWPLYCSCVLGILWFAGLSVSTGQESRIVSRAVLVPFLALAEFGSVNMAILWYAMLIRRHVKIERRNSNDHGMQASGD